MAFINAMGKRAKHPDPGSRPAFLNKTIEQLEGSTWGEPGYQSYVVQAAHALRKKPLSTLTDEELRLALSQKLGLPWIMELAVGRLEENPLRCGDFYAGDVLVCMLNLLPETLDGRSSLQARLIAITAKARSDIHRLDEQERSQLQEALDRFKMA